MSTQHRDTDRSGGLESRVAAEIRAELARRRMQQAELAVLLKEDPSWVSRILGERRRMTVDDLERIAKALGMSAADLLPSDIHQDGHVTARYRDQAKQLDQGHPFGRPLASDESSVRVDQDSRPRRLSLRVPPMPIAQAVAA